MAIRKTGAVTGHITSAAQAEIPLGTDEEGHVVTARVEPMVLRGGTWMPADEDGLATENEAADQG